MAASTAGCDQREALAEQSVGDLAERREASRALLAIERVPSMTRPTKPAAIRTGRGSGQGSGTCDRLRARRAGGGFDLRACGIRVAGRRRCGSRPGALRFARLRLDGGPRRHRGRCSFAAPAAPPASRRVPALHAFGASHRRSEPRLRGARRRGGRVVEGARLESVYTGNRIEGSNPSPSASSPSGLSTSFRANDESLQGFSPVIVP